MLDSALIQEFIYGFYGYGAYSAPYWFIGMEEGGGGSLDEIQQQLAAWDARGRRELEDVASYHRAIGITRFWDEPVRLQSTWNRLIRVLLTAKGQKPSSYEVKDYQKSQLGNENGETCLLELMPLPSPGTAKWLYGKISNLPILANRKKYLEEVSATRIRHIHSRIAEHHPSLILFYGLGYMNYWCEIAGVSFEMRGTDAFYASRIGSTVVVVSKHPAARGITNEYFHKIGIWLGSAMGE